MAITIWIAVQHAEEVDPRNYIDDTERLLAEMNGSTTSEPQDRAPTPKTNEKDRSSDGF